MRNGLRYNPLGCGLALAACWAAMALHAGNASAAQYQLLKSFCEANNCADGKNPQAGLIRDSDGSFYGTAVEGGTTGVGQNGVAFKLTFNNSTQQYDYQVLHNFCSRPGCADGQFPNSALIMDVNGNLYGTTEHGGPLNAGIAYVLRRDRNYALHVLHNFCAISGCTNGSIPETGLTYRGQQNGALYDGVSRLFGSTLRNDAGGDGTGVVYQLKRGKGPFPTRYKVLHSFCLTDCADGEFPSALMMNASGFLYGVAENGGKTGHGVLFRMSASRERFKVLYNFCSKPACADGDEPHLRQTLATDSAGNFYGTTFGGGAHQGGTLWKFVPGAAKETVLHNFCARAGCADGEQPTQGVLLGPSGEIYGTVSSGGSVCNLANNGCGVVFELQDKTFSVLYSFCATGGPSCTDGAVPFGNGALIRDPAGTLYGTTTYGGASNAGFSGGTVFSLTP